MKPIKYSEFFIENTALSFTKKWMSTDPITTEYLIKIGMSEEETIALHQLVWDVSMPLVKPRDRTITSRFESRKELRKLEEKYGLNDYSKRLEGEPEAVTYEQGIDCILENIKDCKKIIITGRRAAGKSTLARIIKRKGKKIGYDIEAVEGARMIGVDNEYIIRTPCSWERDDSIDLRVHLDVPYFRQIINAAKTLLWFRYVPGIMTEDVNKLEHYEIDFNKSIADIVIKYSVGRITFHNALVPIKDFELIDDY